MVFCLPPSFHVRAHQGVCDTPLRFSRDVGTTVFLHLGLRDCFTIQDEFANGEPSSAGRQWCFRDRKQWIESRARSICHLRNEDCFMRKTAITTAIMKLSLAQNGYRNRDNEIVTCANPHRNRDNEIVTPTLRHRQSRWDFAHQGKPFTSLAMEALPAKQRVSSNCEVTLRTRYMTKNHTRYTHKQTCKDDNECDNKQRMDRQTLSDESDWIS